MKAYCYTCMNEIPDGGNYCPHCQRDNLADNAVYRLRPGTILNKKFLVGNCLGEGGFGITYIGRDLTLDRKVAIKEYFPNGYVNRNNNINQLVTATTEEKSAFFQKGLHSFLEEARNAAKLTGVPGIVDVREYFEENCTAYIIMEYLEGVNLSSFIKTNGVFSPEQIFQLMLPITYSLQKMHEAGMIHRDISPDNIMYLYSGSLKLMDFGSARFFSNANREMSVMVKQGYAPEEQYSKNGDQGPWTDVYGLCATIYKCITGRVPEQAIDRIRTDTLIPPSKLGVRISESMEKTLLYGLAVHKNDRCQNMQELSYLMEKALANQNIQVESPNYYNRLNQTLLAEEAVTVQNGYSGSSATQPNSSNGQIPSQSYQRYPGYDSQQQAVPQKSGSKTPVLVAIIIFLCVAIITATVVFLVIHFGSSSDSNTVIPMATTGASAAVQQPTDHTDTTQPSESTTAPATAAPTQAPTVPPTQPPATAAPVSGVISVKASGHLAEQQGHTYDPENVLSESGNCWCPKEGSGVNSWIELDLPQKQTVSGLDLINGYVGTEDQYNNNGKPTKIKIEFSDGSSVTKILSVYPAGNRHTVQHITFSPVETTYVKVTILSIEKGKKWDDTCISYLMPKN